MDRGNLIPWRRKRTQAGTSVEPETSLARFGGELGSLANRLFCGPWGLMELGWPGAVPGGQPSMDLAESENQVTVTLELPGVEPKDVQIDLTGDRLTVRGEKRSETEERKEDHHCLERRFGSFQRTVRLPSTVDPNKVTAHFKNGVLKITIDKPPDAKPRRIQIRET
jgi:HSP20 family protein